MLSESKIILKQAVTRSLQWNILLLDKYVEFPLRISTFILVGQLKNKFTPHINANFTTLQSVPHSPYKQYNTQAPQINCFRVPSHTSCQEDFWCQVTRGPA